MKTTITIVFLLTVLFPGIRLNAQEKWTLKRCISYAIENNMELKQYALQETAADESFAQSKRNLLPTVSASSGVGLSFGRSVDPNTNIISDTRYFNNSYSASASVGLFNGFAALNQIEYQKFRKQASELNRLNATDDLAFNIMSLYFDVLYCQGMLEIAAEQVEISKVNLKKTERQVELGTKSKADQLEMSASYEKEELNRIQIENSLKKAVLSLKQQMNLPDQTDLVLENDVQGLVVSEEADREKLFSGYLQWSPYYQTFEVQLKQSKTMLNISRSQLYPSVSAYGSVGTGYYKNISEPGVAFKTQFKNNLGESVGASLRIPIFSRWSSRSNIKLAKLGIEEAQTRLEQEKQKLYFEMIGNLDDLEALAKEYNQYVKKQAADQLVYEAATKKLEKGMISVVDFYIAKNSLTNTNSQLLQAKLQWEIKKKILDFYTGIRFWE